jgi:hypothetical protein
MAPDPDFGGRVVSVWCKPPGGGGVLENASLERLDQRAFIVGRLADDGKGSDPRIGATFWFPVDEIIMLTVYADLRTAQAAYAASNAPTGENTPKEQKWRFWQ